MIHYETRDNLALLTLDAPPVNALSFALLDELRAALDRANADEQVQAIVLTGGSEHFSAGADLAIFQEIQSGDEAVRTSQVFQQAFQAVEDSPKPVLAAVAGHVLGGALELAMACHLRLAAQGSRFSMPEVNLGINPGAGGTQRLVRLIGVGPALEMLLDGRPIDAPRALGLGLIDAVCPAEQLLTSGVAQCLEAGAGGRRTSQLSDKLDDPAANQSAVAAAEQRLASLRPELVAPRQILAVVQAGLESFAAGLRGEQEAFRQCMASRTAQNKIYLFCASRQTARIPELQSVPAARITQAGVLGMGTMGAGIAQALVTAGVTVAACDQNQPALDAGRRRVVGSLDRRAAQGKLAPAKAQAAIARLTTTLDWQALASTQLVVEAVFEEIEVKRAAIARLEAICPAETIIATNTSTISLDVLAEGMRHPQRLVGLHFFHPAQQMPLVEVIRRRSTPPEVTATALALAKAIGKTPVLVENREGFVVNRVFIPYIVEAFWLLEEGADPTEIDAAMVEFGLPMGPLQLIDMSGLDILVKTHTILSQAFAHHGRLSSIVDRLVEDGRLGQKTGSGVYRYEPGDYTPHADPAAEAILAAARQQRPSSADRPDREAITARLLLRMVVEAFGLLEEGVVSRGADVDVAMVLGTGLPDFRGGVVKYACDLGLDQVCAALQRLSQQCGPRYSPGRLLKQVAATGQWTASNG